MESVSHFWARRAVSVMVRNSGLSNFLVQVTVRCCENEALEVGLWHLETPSGSLACSLCAPMSLRSSGDICRSSTGLCSVQRRCCHS
jgi:hypothetical protein